MYGLPQDFRPRDLLAFVALVVAVITLCVIAIIGVAKTSW